MIVAATNYPPLTRRHKVVFACAGMLGLCLGVGIALGRLALIRWWLGHCPTATTTCRSAEFAFDWWWVPLVGVLLAVAYGAHRLTRDRLSEAPSAPAGD